MDESVIKEPVVDTELVVEEPVDKTDEDVHPLEPGGKRFAEVYADMKEALRRADDADRRARETQDELSRLKTETQKPREQIYTAQQLQVMVDAGQITPAVMADQLAYQRARESEIRQERTRAEESKKSSALSEVDAFLNKVPHLRNPNSEDFQRVAREAYRVADETGLSVQDPRTQRLALRAVYGPLEKVTSLKQTREFERRNADNHAETERGGSSSKPVKDPLKDVPQMYRDHWKRLGYSQEKMVEEAKFITPRKRS